MSLMILRVKKSFFSYEERSEIVASSQYVDFVFPKYHWEQKRNDVIKHQVDIFGMGMIGGANLMIYQIFVKLFI